MSHTLLLADDSVTIQRVIELTFAEEDVQVVAVSDGDQAIARLDATPPDIVLADIGMPGKNGYEVAQYVKRTPRLAHIPVVLLTGAFEPVDDAKAAAAGCAGVLAKPFEPQLVIGRVKELLARGTAPSPSASPAPAARPLAAVPPQTKPILDDVERYFDQLDAAFATLKKEPIAAPQPVEEPPQAEEPLATDETTPDIPLSYASLQSAFGTASSPGAVHASPEPEEARNPENPENPENLFLPSPTLFPRCSPPSSTRRRPPARHTGRPRRRPRSSPINWLRRSPGASSISSRIASCGKRSLRSSPR